MAKLQLKLKQLCSANQATVSPGAFASLATDSAVEEDTRVDTIESVQALLLEARVKAEVDGEDYQQQKPAGLSGQCARMQDRTHATQADLQASVPERPQIPPQTTATVERDASTVDTAAAVPVVVNAHADRPPENSTREEDESGSEPDRNKANDVVRRSAERRAQ